MSSRSPFFPSPPSPCHPSAGAGVNPSWGVVAYRMGLPCISVRKGEGAEGTNCPCRRRLQDADGSAEGAVFDGGIFHRRGRGRAGDAPAAAGGGAAGEGEGAGG